MNEDLQIIQWHINEALRQIERLKRRTRVEYASLKTFQIPQTPKKKKRRFKGKK